MEVTYLVSHCSSSGRTSIQLSGFGFVCSVSSYRIDIFSPPFYRSTVFILPWSRYFSLAGFINRINCALAHPKLELIVSQFDPARP